MLLEFLNCYHATIKFAANYSQEEISFLDVSPRKKNNQLVTDLYIKPTDTHQYLDATSCHVYDSKRSIHYSEALRLNRVCSKRLSYNKRCNELEVWLMEREYGDKLVREHALVKHTLNNIQGVQKIFRHGLITLDVSTKTFSKVKKLNKGHLTLILLKLIKLLRMIGK